MNKAKMRIRPRLRSLVGFVISVVFILPLYWGIVASLGPVGEAPSGTISWWASSPHWENYATIFEIVPLAQYTINSLFVVVFAVPLSVVTASLAGFALTQFGRGTQTLVINLSIGMLLVPSAAVWLFRFQLLIWLGLLNSLWALILPAFAASSPLFVLLFYWNYLRIPEETIDAAWLDGASAGKVWWNIAVPLSIPTVIGVGVLSFALYWSDFVSPVLYLYTPTTYTLPIGLQLINQVGSTNWPLLMAGAVFMAAPVLLFFFVFQRYFLSDASLAGLFDRN